jgi:hypothetical protein
VSESLGIQEDLIPADPITGKSSLPFLQEEEDYNLKTNALLRDFITTLLQQDSSLINWDESSILKTPFTIGLDLSYKNGEKKKISIELSKSKLGTATEFNNLLKLVGKNQEEPQFEEDDDTAVKINKVNDFLKAVLLAVSTQAEESTALMHEVLPPLEATKEFFSQGGGSKVLPLEDEEVSFLLEALRENPRIGPTQSASFLHRIIEALETSD